MKIRMFKDIHLPNASYIEGQILNSEDENYEDKHYENMFNLFIEAGYAEEVRELANHYVQHKEHGQHYLHFPICQTCKYVCCYSNEAPCTYCKLRDMQADINSKLIDLIKSL
jgi:hypothetical protein